MTLKTILDQLDIASLVALLALFVAVWQVISSRNHNKLSVQPYLNETLSSDAVNLICKFEIANKGLGPAIISSSQYYLDGTKINYKALLNIIDKLPTEFGINVQDLKPGSVIAKDEIYPLIKIQWDHLKHDLPKSNETKAKISKDIASYGLEISKRFGIEITYKSHYGGTFRLESFPSKQNSDKP